MRSDASTSMTVIKMGDILILVISMDIKAGAYIKKFMALIFEGRTFLVDTSLSRISPGSLSVIHHWELSILRSRNECLVEYSTQMRNYLLPRAVFFNHHVWSWSPYNFRLLRLENTPLAI